MEKDIKYFACIPSLVLQDYIYSPVEIDSRYSLEQSNGSEGGYFYFIPLTKGEHPEFEDAVFYLNCISFENEALSWLFEENEIKLFEPIEPPCYCDPRSLLEEIADLKLGMITINFSGDEDDDDEIIRLNYSQKYSKRRVELSFYAQALRQSDPFSEYLHYYRILESITKNNAKDWIEKEIDNVIDFDFGKLNGEKNYRGKRSNIDVYKILKEKYLKRINEIRGAYSMPIGKYLYSVNRCGIAHGSEPIDFDTKLSDIRSDIYVVKLLSKMAVLKNL